MMRFVHPLLLEAPEYFWLIFLITLILPLLFWRAILSDAIGNFLYRQK